MFVVIDTCHSECFGPFDSSETAAEWLAKQGIYDGQYDDQEVRISEVLPSSASLKDINKD